MPRKRILTNKNIAIKKCKHGYFAYLINDRFVGKSLDLYGEWTEPELILLNDFIFPGSVVVDVGAFIGTHTIFFAKKVGPRGFVFAIEPQRMIYNLLNTNIALNNHLNVKSFNVALSDKRGQTTIPLMDPDVQQNFGAFSVGHKNGEPTPVVTLDELKLPACNLIKADVEGMEAKVLKGGSDTIKKYRPVLYIENNRMETSKEIIKTLITLRYTCYWHILEYYNPNNYFKYKKNIFSEFRPEANLICVPKEVEFDLKGSTKVTGPEDNWEKAIKRLATKAESRL